MEREAHSDCSEGFYRKEIETDIKSAPLKSAEERNKMLALLRKFEEGNAEGPDVFTQDDDLTRQLEEINLGTSQLSKLGLHSLIISGTDEADPDVIWSMLSPSQRCSFSEVIRDPSNELAQQLLSSIELQEERRKPWWESSLLEGDESSADSKRLGVPPKMISIPRTLTSPKTVSRSNCFLLYNILTLW